MIEIRTAAGRLIGRIPEPREPKPEPRPLCLLFCWTQGANQ